MKKAKKKQAKATRKDIALIQQMQNNVMGPKYARVFEFRIFGEVKYRSASLWSQKVVGEDGADNCNYAGPTISVNADDIIKAARKGFLHQWLSGSSPENGATCAHGWYEVTPLGKRVAAGK